jgi:serine/threonine protein kinase
MSVSQARAKSIFLNAVEISLVSERQAYVAAECGDDEALRREVEALLEHHQGVGSILEAAAPGLPIVTVDEPITERPGTVIGPYKLLEQIGEGGMGTVWMAQQTEPVKRVVALKLIKAGMDSRQVIARFEAERQALALMDHPHIAKVFDGGTTAAGRPYFVMELVKGVPLTRYCDEHRLTPKLRLELFIPVCQAIQHAHQKGIIHRDIKPSNVLVALYDGKPVPKVIDFGVAKAAGQSLTDKTLVTGFGNIVGTLEYMLPEQAEINQQDIDTRSDIYSLGVLLYELLAGSPPFSRKELEKAGMLEMLRVIREKEPSKPSAKLSTADGLPTLAANRSTEPAKLTKLVRGELDWIVMKALEKDRSRRYETANTFAMDVQRYLADEPVQACPPSAGYRLRKFVRRNKGAVLAASLVMLTFVAGFIGTAWEMVRAVAAEATAVHEATQKEAALKDTEAALTASRKQLWESLVAEARATRLSRRSGQRFKSLELLQRASQLATTFDLPAAKLHEQRNAALAALAVPDLYLTGPWVTCPADALAFDFDENHASCACTDRQGVCSIRRVADDVELHRLKGPAHPYFSPDGKFIALTQQSGVQLWQLDGPTARPLRPLENGAREVCFHPNAQRVAFAYRDGAIALFELPSGRQLSRLPPKTLTREIRIALHPTEPLVAVCSYWGSVVQLRNLQTGKVVASLPQCNRACSVAWHPDGRTLAVGLATAMAIDLYDLKTLRLFRTLKTDSAVVYLAFNHGGDRLAAIGWGQWMQLFDVGTGQKLFATPLATPQVSLCVPDFSRDDRRLAGAVHNGKLGTWQVGDSREYRTLGAVQKLV